MKRKILSLILVFAMTVSLLTVGTGAVEPTYGDTAGHWAESSIERWSAYGIIQGSNGLFDPNGQLTCAQLATILAKLLKLPAAKDAGFTDNTADAWYYDAINRCAAAGILNGNGDGTVTPEAPITRERAMVMLARALGIEPIRKPDLAKYTDAAQVSAYAQGYVAALIKAGIVGGVGDNRLAPQDNITRASTVTILDRAIGTYADKDGMTVNAKDGELVLVVAKNVKVINAPEGTKIVVADGATGLTVNGKAVSDDQTYIVPKTTSSGSSSGGYSHSHNWVDNYCAGCNQFKDTVVAAIGTKGYENLAAAVAAAHDGDTVKLVGNTELDADVSISNKITLDLDDKTIETKGNTISIAATGDLTVTGNGIVNNNTEATVETVNGNKVGVRYTMFAVDAGGKLDIENGTFKTKASQIVYTEGATIIADGTFENTADDVNEGLGSSSMLCAKGPSAVLTMNGGSIIATAESQDNGIYGIYGANGAQITLNDSVSVHTSLAAIGMNNTTSNPEVVVTINGGEYKTTNTKLGTSYPKFNTVVYLPGKCHVTINGGTFTAEDANTHIFSVPYVKVGVNLSISNGTFDGKTEVFFTGTQALSGQNEANNIAITGGTFSSDPIAYVAEGYKAVENGDGTWVVREKENKAQVGGKNYEKLSDAIKASNSTKDTITLTANTTVELENGVANEGEKSRNITIKGDGTQTADVITKATDAEGGKLSYQRGSTFTFENMTIQAGEGNFDGIVCGELTFKECTIKGKLTLYGNATFIDCTFDNTMENQYSIWTWGGKDVTFENCTFNTNGKAILLYGQATAEKPTNLTVSSCTFNDRNNGSAGKAAIEIGNDYNATYKLTVTKATVNGFADGKNTGSKLWANKNSMDATHLSVTIDSTKVF